MHRTQLPPRREQAICKAFFPFLLAFAVCAFTGASEAEGERSGYRDDGSDASRSGYRSSSPDPSRKRYRQSDTEGRNRSRSTTAEGYERDEKREEEKEAYEERKKKREKKKQAKKRGDRRQSSDDDSEEDEWDEGEDADEEEDPGERTLGRSCMYGTNGKVIFRPRGGRCKGDPPPASTRRGTAQSRGTPVVQEHTAPAKKKQKQKRGSGSCIYGAGNKVLYAPKGADCAR